jgi:hypothetical protein
MIDLEEVSREGAMTLAEAAAYIESIMGKRPSSPQIWRWAAKGLQDGTKLESVRLGKKWLTTKSAVARFVQGYRPNAEGFAPAALPVLSKALPLRVCEPHDRRLADGRLRQISEAKARLSRVGLRFLLV